jgi:hypothetical protein
MTKNRVLIAATAAMLGAFAFAAVAPTATSATAIGNSSISLMPDSNLQLIDTKKKDKKETNKKVVKKKVWVYDAGKHGKRYKYKNGPYVYYYGGYYYTRPWWTVAVPGVSVCIGC